MRIKQLAAYGALVGGMTLAALGFSAGFAHAETGTIVPGIQDQTIHQIEQNQRQTHAQDPSERDAGRQASEAEFGHGHVYGPGSNETAAAAPASGGEAFPRDHPIPDQHGMASTATPSSTSAHEGATNADN